MPMTELVLPQIQPTLIPMISGGFFPVRRIYCVGRDYVSHIREMKEADEREPPFFFQKPRDAIILDGETIEYPPETNHFQYEVELVAAIGVAGRFISPSAASDFVWGYAVGLDMTRRDRQREAREKSLPWEAGKSFDQSAPCGPIYPTTLVGHPNQGAITLSVNELEHQRGDIGEMIWNVPEIVSQLSKQVWLRPGDLILHGDTSRRRVGGARR